MRHSGRIKVKELSDITEIKAQASSNGLRNSTREYGCVCALFEFNTAVLKTDILLSDATENAV